MMMSLAMFQILAFMVQCCCCWVPLLGTPVKDDEHEQKKIEKREREQQARMA